MYMPERAVHVSLVFHFSLNGKPVLLPAPLDHLEHLRKIDGKQAHAGPILGRGGEGYGGRLFGIHRCHLLVSLSRRFELL